MKKLLLIILGMICLVSCDNRTEEQRWKDYQAKQEKEKAKADSIMGVKYKGFQVIIIDSCEYLIKKESSQGGHRGFGYGFMSHKGNCKFCEERRKQNNTNHECK